MRINILSSYILFLILLGCTNRVIRVVNEKNGKLIPLVNLEIVSSKKYALDYESAPKPQYTQIYSDLNGIRYFTFLNKYNNSIYFYDYLNESYVKKISFNKKGVDEVKGLMGYYIYSLDSIFLYSKPLVQILIGNKEGKILNRISLKNNKPKDWFKYYPQYVPYTVSPFIKRTNEIILTGQYLYSLPESSINSFKFTTRVDLKTNHVSFNYSYPLTLYGSNYNWNGRLFTEVFTELHPDGDKLIFSFPVSHDLYIADLNSEVYQKVYSGSNNIKEICSLNKEPIKTSDMTSQMHFVQQDTYSAIIYDKYRKVYYRYVLLGKPDATINESWREKPVSVIIMDKDFNYLGETKIGIGEREWFWQNSFVTEEGLNIEYIEKDIDEHYLNLRIFKIKKI